MFLPKSKQFDDDFNIQVRSNPAKVTIMYAESASQLGVVVQEHH